MDFSCLKERGRKKFSPYDAGFKGLDSYFWASQHLLEAAHTGDVETKPESPLAGAASSSDLDNFCSSQTSSFYAVAKRWHPESRGDQTVMKLLNSWACDDAGGCPQDGDAVRGAAPALPHRGAPAKHGKTDGLRREGASEVLKFKLKTPRLCSKQAPGWRGGCSSAGQAEPPLSEGGRDARGRRGGGGWGSLRGRGCRDRGVGGHWGNGGCRDRGTPASLTCAVGSSLTAGPGRTPPTPGQCREAARPPLPGQGGVSSHLEEPGEPLFGNFPRAPGTRPVPLAALPRRQHGPPAPPGASGLRGPGGAEQGQGMGTFRSAQSPAGRNRGQEPCPRAASSPVPWPQRPRVSWPGSGWGGARSPQRGWGRAVARLGHWLAALWGNPAQNPRQVRLRLTKQTLHSQKAHKAWRETRSWLCFCWTHSGRYSVPTAAWLHLLM